MYGIHDTDISCTKSVYSTITTQKDGELYFFRPPSSLTVKLIFKFYLLIEVLSELWFANFACLKACRFQYNIVSDLLTL